jgi:hypothetical protein
MYINFVGVCVIRYLCTACALLRHTAVSDALLLVLAAAAATRTATATISSHARRRRRRAVLSGRRKWVNQFLAIIHNHQTLILHESRKILEKEILVPGISLCELSQFFIGWIPKQNITRKKANETAVGRGIKGLKVLGSSLFPPVNDILEVSIVKGYTMSRK